MEKEVLESIYSLYYQDLYLYAFSLCRNHSLTEDIVSDTFFKALVSLPDKHTNIKYWLMTVCRNLIYDYYNKQKRINDIPVEEMNISIEDETLAKLIKEEQSARIYYAILQLPDVYREVIYMYYFMEMSGEVIANTLNISHGNVRNILYRARIKLKKKLEEESE